MKAVWVVVAVGFLGCHGSRTAADLKANDCHVDFNDTNLGPGDVFDVRVYDEPQLTGTYRVAANGSISFPLIGEVKVAGQGPPEVGKLLQAKLAEGHLRNPQVSIFVKEYNSKKVSVLGQVTHPGTFPYTESMTLIQAVTLAGGPTPIAAKDDTIITRADAQRTQRINVHFEAISEGHERDLCLRPGDVVFVPERLF